MLDKRLPSVASVLTVKVRRKPVRRIDEVGEPLVTSRRCGSPAGSVVAPRVP